MRRIKLRSTRKGCRRVVNPWVFNPLPKGIQRVFVGYSRGIRVQKRVFRNFQPVEPIKTYGFFTHQPHDGATELPLYNIKRGRDLKKGAEGSREKDRAGF